jgi:hypothetical protein
MQDTNCLTVGVPLFDLHGGSEALIVVGSGGGELLLQLIDVNLLHLELVSEVVEDDLVRRHGLPKWGS